MILLPILEFLKRLLLFETILSHFERFLVVFATSSATVFPCPFLASGLVLELVFAMLKPFNAFFNRRVSAKEVVDYAFFERIIDK